MAESRASAVLKHIRRLAADLRLDQVPDECLVRSFVENRDGAAFEALVRRHGPMVLRVCRQVVRHAQDAEDIFQTTFLVLARKAAGIRKQASVASWLHGVAYRLAAQAREARARQRTREEGVAVPQLHTPADVTWQELQEGLHEELVRLGAAYRAPLVLCYLEGKTQDEAACRLGWSVATLRRRLERGRKLLYARLSRRGLTLPAALLAAGLSQHGLEAAVPRALVTSTVAAAQAFSAGAPAAGPDIAGRVTALAQSGSRRLIVVKLKAATALLLAFSIVGGGAALLTLPARTGTPTDEGNSPGRDHPPQVVAQPEIAGPRLNRTDAFGDPLPPGALFRLGTVRFRHGGDVSGLALAPQGDLLATAGGDGTVCLWDMATGQERLRFHGHVGGVRSVAFTPDGSGLVSAGSPEDRTVRLWEVSTGKELGRFKTAGYWFGHVAISADGRVVAGGGDRHRVVLWEARTRRLLHELGGDEQTSFAVPVAFSLDGQTLASGGEAGTIRLWNVASGKEQRRLLIVPPLKDIGPPHYNGLVQAVAFAPDGRILASSALGSATRLWDVSTGKEIRALPSAGDSSLAFSPDGKTIACGEGMGAVRTCDWTTGAELARFQAYGRYVSGLAFTRDGKILATSGDTAVRLWDPRRGVELVTDRGHAGGIASCTLLPDQRTLITQGFEGAIREWDLATGKQRRRLARPDPSSSGMALSRDGNLAALYVHKKVGEREHQVGVRLWDLTANKELALLWRPNIFSASFAPDGKTLFTYSWDIKERAGVIRLWDAQTGKELRTVARRQNGFKGFVLAADGKTLAFNAQDLVAGKWEKNVFVWDAAKGKELRRLPVSPEFGQTVAFSADGRLVAVADGYRLRPDSRVFHQYLQIGEIAGGKAPRQFAKSTRAFLTIAFSPDARTLVSAGEDNRIRLWEVATGGERLQIAGHTGRVTSLLFADHGRKLISASADTTALVWDMSRPHSPSPADPQACWRALADVDAAKAYAGVRDMAAAPGHAVTFLRQHLQPVQPTDAKAIAALVRALDSPVFTERQKASAELSKLDRLAEPALRTRLAAQPSLELRQRIVHLLEKAEAGASPDQLRTGRALEVLESIATPEAVRFLGTLAKGAPAARLTEQAKASLQRLSSRPVPP